MALRNIIIMQINKFREYLHSSYGGGRKLNDNTINARISNCKHMEEFEGDLDVLFDYDQLENLLARLRYTKEDQRAHKPLKHKIPIKGNWYTGTATLKSATTLYQSFRIWQTEGGLPNVVTTQTKWPDRPTVATGTRWPVWTQPNDDDALMLAKIVARFARFLQPEIVRAVVDDNERHLHDWSEGLRRWGIDPRAYLWSKSALCVSWCTPLRWDHGNRDVQQEDEGHRFERVGT